MATLKQYFLFVVFIMTYFSAFAQRDQQVFSYEETSNFTSRPINDSSIEWGYLTVPENWFNKDSNTVKIAVTVLKSKSGSKGDAVVFLPGGPGGGATSGIQMWLNHPIRENNDIILIDFRGTGYSEPRLCPDLGELFMQILAGDYDFQEEVDQRVFVSLGCRDELIQRNIDIWAYNSLNIAHDLNALKKSLGYDQWMLYGVSYGTRTAFEYAKQFPDDIKKMVLDSQVLPSGGLYDNNTSNFMRSLNILFKECKEDKACYEQYGDLEELFYNTIKDLNQNSLTIKVSPEIVTSGTFTLNAQDFLLAVQQSLYDPMLYEVLPLMITEFSNRNESMVAALVDSMNNKLSLDYGTFYSVLCNETLPISSVEIFELQSSKFEKGVTQGISFYKSDYYVCDAWYDSKDSSKIHDKFSKDSIIQFQNPVLLISGEFDPVTPPENGELAKKYFANNKHVVIPNKGHAAGFWGKGKDFISSFFTGPMTIETADTGALNEPQKFVSGVVVNGGVNKFGTSIFRQDLLILIPYSFSLLIFLIGLFYVPIKVWRLWKKCTPPEKLLYIGIWTVFLLSIIFTVGIVLSILETADTNFYILAFGIPNQYLPLLIIPYVVLTLLVVLLFIKLKFSKIRVNVFFMLTMLSTIIFLVLIFRLGLFL